MTTVQHSNELVSLASIAAELHAVMTVAQGVSLAAKNAKVISAQAGEKGLGFQPITNFIDEISQTAIQGVDEINRKALQLSRLAVTEQRSYDAYRRFSSVKTRYQDARHIESMYESLQGVQTTMLETSSRFKKDLNHLMRLLESMNETMLSARSIASVSRIVTSDAQEYRAKLQVVADDLDKAAIFIKEKVTDSYKHLNRVEELAHKHV
ncbi:MAG: chemotaxis protein [Gammaproteobacteria bacterium]|nr:chemotaxis protein [Gammaproteobacteria bacterium]